MTLYRKIPRALAVLAAVLLGAGAAAAQPLDGDDDRTPTADAFTACQTVGTWFGPERFLCYRAAANLANERRMLPRPPTRPIVIEGAGFDWTDAGVGFAAAAGLGLIGAGAVLASTGSLPRRRRRSTGAPQAGSTTEVAIDLRDSRKVEPS
jgi:hypothetical protein